MRLFYAFRDFAVSVSGVSPDRVLIDSFYRHVTKKISSRNRGSSRCARFT